MGRKNSPPSYCHHKPTNQAYVRVNGRMVYLGEFNSPQSRCKYAEIIAEWSAGNLNAFGQSISVARLAIAYTSHAKLYYRKNNQATSHVYKVRSALKYLVGNCRNVAVENFTPKHLEQVRRSMIDAGLSRRAINDYTEVIKQTFQFGVCEGSVPPNVYAGLKALPGLRKGRSAARETSPIQPVSPLQVIKTLRELNPVVSAMVRLQYVTGMRPGEVCSMRVSEIDRSSDVWKYQPKSHKTEHHGKDRLVLLGRKSQRILTPFLNRSESSYVFSPSQLNDLRSQDAVAGKTEYADCYTNTTYRRAITRASRRAEVQHWTPNQLRHTYATVIRKRYGLEAAQILLGHSKADVTQVYAERDEQLAEKVAKEAG